MNQHPSQIDPQYVAPLSGEDSIEPIPEANELEGIVENIRKTVFLPANANAPTKGNNDYIFHNLIKLDGGVQAEHKNFATRALANLGILTKEAKRDRHDTGDTNSPAQQPRKSLLDRFPAARLEKPVKDENEFEEEQQVKKDKSPSPNKSPVKTKKMKKKRHTTLVREKMVLDLQNILNEQEKTSYDLGEKITAMCATEDSKYLIVASHYVKIMNKNSPNQIKAPDLLSPELELPDFTRSLGDIEKIKQPCSLMLINLKTKEKEKFALEGDDLNSDKEILSLGVTSDSSLVIAGWNDGSITLYDFDLKKRLHSQKDGEHGVTSITVSSDNNYFIAARGKDRFLRIYNLNERAQRGVIEHGHTELVRTVIITSKNRFVITGSYDGTIKVFNFEKQTLFHTFDSRNFTSISQGDSLPVLCLTITHDSQYIVAAFEDKTLRIFDIEKKESVHVFEKFHQSWTTSIAITPDDKFAIVGSSAGLVMIFDLIKKEKIHSFGNIHQKMVASVVATKNGRFIASGSQDNFVHVYRVEKSGFQGIIRDAHTRGVDALMITRDQKYIVSGSYDRQLRIFDSATRRSEYRFKLSNVDTHFKCVAITSDNKWVIAGTDDSSIHIYDIKNSHREPLDLDSSQHLNEIQNSQPEPYVFENVHEHFVNALGITKDDKYLVSAGGKDIRVFNFYARELIHTYKNAHDADIYCLSVTMQNDYIVTGSKDHSIRVFKLNDKTEGLVHVFEKAHNGIDSSLLIIKDEKGPVTCLAVSEDDKYIVSGSIDRSIRIFDLEKRELIHKFVGAHEGILIK